MENERRSVDGKHSRPNLGNSLAVFANTSVLPDSFLSNISNLVFFLHLRPGLDLHHNAVPSSQLSYGLLTSYLSLSVYLADHEFLLYFRPLSKSCPPGIEGRLCGNPTGEVRL